METFSALLAICGHRWIPSTKASDAELWWFFICAWINDWVNNREAGDLRRHRAHYDIIVTSRLRQTQQVVTEAHCIHIERMATEILSQEMGDRNWGKLLFCILIVYSHRKTVKLQDNIQLSKDRMQICAKQLVTKW